MVACSTIGCGRCSYCRAGYYAQRDVANPNGPDAGTCFFGGPQSTGPVLGHGPSESELASRLGVTPGEINEARQAGQVFTARSPVRAAGVLAGVSRCRGR